MIAYTGTGLASRPTGARVIAPLAATFAFVAAMGCSPTKFQTSLGTTSYDQSIGINTTSDGGYVVCGYLGSPSPHFVMAKLAADGAPMWQHSPAVATPGLRGSCHEITGGYLLVSSVQVQAPPPPVTNPSHVYVLAVDGDGVELSSTTLETAGDEIVLDAAPVGPNRFVVTGWYQDGSALGVRVLLTAIDAAGERSWTTPVDHAGNERGEEVASLAGGDVMVAGSAGPVGPTRPSPFLARFDVSGNLLWNKTYTDLGAGSFESLTELPDGTVIAGGYLGPSPSSTSQGVLIAVDPSGTPIWTKSYPSGPTIFEDLITVTSGNFVAAGTWSAGTSASQDALLAQLDPDGAEVWSQRYGGSAGEYAMDLHSAADGGLVLAGGTASYGLGDFDVYVVKTDALGQTGPPPG